MVFKTHSIKILTTLVNQIFHKSVKRSLATYLNNLLLKMPRNQNAIFEVQQQRLKIKKKSLKYAPGTVNLQVLGSGAPGSPASVYLFTDNTRYLFNCGEGTQRLAHEHKIKLGRLEHIFMTRTSWGRIGGLPGLSLTVQDSGVPELILHGPTGLDELFRGMRRFVILKSLKVNTVDCSSGGEYNDSVITIKYVPLKRKRKNVENAENDLSMHENFSEDTIEDDTDYYAYERRSPRSRSNSPSKSMPLNNTKREEDTVISYICKLKPKLGSLDLEKCVEKGVPPGPLLGQLKSGINVTLPDGTVVRADEVTGATDPGPVFIILDIPNEEYLESLEEASSIFKEYQSDATEEEKVASVVVHFSPPNIIETKIYQQFLERFFPSTKHIAVNSSNQFSGYVAAHKIQLQLNQINPYVFPKLKENVSIDNGSSSSNCKRIRLSDNEDSFAEDQNLPNSILHNVKTLTYYHLRPRKGLDRALEPSVQPSKYIQEIEVVEGFPKSLQELSSILNDYYKSVKVERDDDYPKIVFLGTGSCIPNKTRNVSAILINTTKNSSILLDCGEGTLGQIIRFYGKDHALDIIRNLKAIYISHLHADHHIGLIEIIQARQELFKNISPLLLFAPKQINSWLHFYNQRIEPIDTGYLLIANDSLIEEKMSNPLLSEIGIDSIRTCQVVHCPYSYGVAIVIDNEKVDKKEAIKITYSGDTMPCAELVKLGKDSTILIHEATMEDELLDEAKFKMHSTVSQAIEQGSKMNAKHTILSHFSQRYSKIPRIEKFLENNVGIAFDNMEITLNDLNCLHLMYPTLKIMFTEHCEEMDHKAFKRAMKKERKRRASKSESSPVG